MQLFAGKQKNSGSAILWAVIALGMLSVFILGALSVASGYSRRVTASNEELQAYYTARTVAEAVADRLAADQSLLPAAEGGVLEIPEVTGLPAGMGTASAKIERLSVYAARVTVDAAYGHGSYSYAADLAAACVEVPYFTSGLVLDSLDGSEDFEIEGDLYLTGTAPCLLNCRVSGSVFAPGCAVTVGSTGFVGGSIFATRIIYQTGEPPLSAAARDGIAGLPADCVQNVVPEPYWSRLFTGVLAAAEPPAYASEAASAGYITAPAGNPKRVRLTGGNTYYVREDVILGDDVQMQMQGSGDIVIVVKPGCTLSISKAVEHANRQNIIIVLQDGASLSYPLPENQTLPMSIYGSENTAVHLAGKDKTVTVEGVIRVGTLTSDAPLVFSGGDSGSRESRLVPVAWQVAQRSEGEEA